MKLRAWLHGALLLSLLAGCDPLTPAAKPAADERKVANKQEPTQPGTEIEVIGRTQPVPSRRALMAPVPLHPVVEISVAPGDRVKKGQPLIRLDDDEPKADVRVKEAAVVNAEVALKESNRYLEVSEKAYRSGALPEQRWHEARVAYLKAEADLNSAKAALDGSKAELEHYTVEAEIDGVVSWMDVHLGMVSRPGTTVWGEILDLSEIDVRCEVTPDQADQLAVGRTAEVRVNGKKEPCATGRVQFVGLSADRASGLVPVVVRMDNGRAGLRCEVPVRVRFVKTAVKTGEK